MDQFRNFEKFITRINDYGMQAGIVKVIPPPEWYPGTRLTTGRGIDALT